MLVLLAALTTWLAAPARALEPTDQGREDPARPNVLLCIADDWGWPHAGVLGDPVVRTPTFDRLAREGLLFERAFVSSPSCTPSRNALLTGQHFWRLGPGANLHSTLPVEHPVYPLLLERAGYHVGHWRKSFGPGRLEPGGYVDSHPAGERYGGFAEFLDARPEGAPFCFWLGSSDPHRPYEAGSGAAAGMELERVSVPPFWPDEERVRSDLADYYFEVQRFDREVGEALALLEARGELANTVVVMTGDHGMPFPRCKSNVYELGVRVPLAIRWPAGMEGGRRSDALVSFTDLAPTFLELAGLDVPDVMTGRSLVPLLRDSAAPWRDHVLFGKERHVPSQPRPSMAGYPSRAVRTDGWAYIRNFSPDLWPAGIGTLEDTPMGWVYSDCDGGPAKSAVLEAEDRRYFAWCFGKRPAEELYDLRADPYQLVNLAAMSEHEEQRHALAELLGRELAATGDPRASGEGEAFDAYPYYGRSLREK
jgi:arylsulfatase A-like enzyme